MATMKDFKNPHDLPCDRCRFRKFAQNNPDSLLARFWLWHTRWCPGWKAYEKVVAEREALKAEQESCVE